MIVTRRSPWRRRIGVTLFVLHLILPFVALFVVPLLGLPEGVNATLFGLSVVGGPDVLIVASIAVMGKDGVVALMSRFGGIVRRVTKWDQVTRTRYNVGLWVLMVSLVVPTAVLLFWGDSIESIGGAPGWGFWVLLLSTFAFIGAIISMGAPMWSRIEALFRWDARIVFSDGKPSDDPQSTA